MIPDDRARVHIALVNQWYPPETGGGGVATHNHDFAVACVRLGHKVTVIAQQPRKDVPTRRIVDGVTILREPALNLYRFRRLPVVGRQYRIAQALAYSKVVCNALEALNRETPVDIAEFADVNAEGFFWNSSMSKRLAVRCHTPNWILQRYHLKSEMPFDSRLLGGAERKVIRRAHVLTAPSMDMAEVVSRDCGLPLELIHPIPNALDTDRYFPTMTKAKGDDRLVLFVGRLERAKGVDILIDAIPHVLAKAGNARFMIVGEPRGFGGGRTYKDYVCDRLGEFIRRGKVIVTGFLPDDQLANAYAQADFTVVPSLLYESFSFTCAQSMAFGVPVVASRIGGMPETLDFGKCGIIVQPGSPEELANGILTLLHDRSLRSKMGKLGRERAVNCFSSKVVAKQIIELYKNALMS